MRLTVGNHDRESAGLTYVYPVVSRRAGGVSLGINLNPNNACNWRCVYCQVPGLVFGNAPPIDALKLERELRSMLERIVRGDFLAKHAPEGARELKDVAFSGNGEPTSAKEFPEIVARVGRVLAEFELLNKIPIVLITNGSLVHQEHVRRGIQTLATLGGVVWFKLDSATDRGQRAMNDAKLGPAHTRKNLEIAARACPTWIQTMMLARNGETPSVGEQEAYLDFVSALVRDRVPVKGVLLYGLARPSHQPEAKELSALPREWMERFAKRIENAGLEVRLSV